MPDQRAILSKPPSEDDPSPDDQLYMAWVIIANARDWQLDDDQAAEWREAAERWRDQWHTTLNDAEGATSA